MECVVYSLSSFPQGNIYILYIFYGASQALLVVKNPPANAGDARDVGLIPGSGRFPGGGHGNPLQYSCLENPMDRGAMVGYNPQGCKELDTTEAT